MSPDQTNRLLTYSSSLIGRRGFLVHEILALEPRFLFAGGTHSQDLMDQSMIIWENLKEKMNIGDAGWVDPI